MRAHTYECMYVNIFVYTYVCIYHGKRAKTTSKTNKIRSNPCADFAGKQPASVCVCVPLRSHGVAATLMCSNALVRSTGKKYHKISAVPPGHRSAQECRLVRVRTGLLPSMPPPMGPGTRQVKRMQDAEWCRVAKWTMPALYQHNKSAITASGRT